MKNKNKSNKKNIQQPDENLITRKHIYILIILSLLSKIITIGLTIFVFNSYIDYFDLRTYAVKSILLMNGQLPYISFTHEYPILALFPNIFTIIPASLFNNVILIFPSFQMIMIIFDILTTICVYFIALKVYNNQRTAFISGIIYTFCLCAAYTVLTRFDSFPVFLMMASIFIILNNKQSMVGYLGILLGFFTKIFPIISLPFLILYESKINKELLKGRIKLNVILYSVFSMLLVVPLIFLIGWDKTIKPYLFATGDAVNSVYANTMIYMIYGWIHDVFRIPISINIFSDIMTVISVLIIIGLLFLAYKMDKISELNLIQFIGVSLVIFITFSKFHSPQYFMWITPIFAILVANDLYKIIVFFITQFLFFIEFPIMFGHYYTNVDYVNQSGTYGWYITLLFFTVEYIFIFLMVKMNILETIKYNVHQYIIR